MKMVYILNLANNNDSLIVSNIVYKLVIIFVNLIIFTFIGFLTIQSL